MSLVPLAKVIFPRGSCGQHGDDGNDRGVSYGHIALLVTRPSRGADRVTVAGRTHKCFDHPDEASYTFTCHTGVFLGSGDVRSTVAPSCAIMNASWLEELRTGSHDHKQRPSRH